MLRRESVPPAAPVEAVRWHSPQDEGDAQADEQEAYRGEKDGEPGDFIHMLSPT